MPENKNILVTGCAGFIGFHAAKRLLKEGYNVVGLDNLNDYYDVKLKKDRLAILHNYDAFIFIKASLEDRMLWKGVFQEHSFGRVLHLAAQAGCATA